MFNFKGVRSTKNAKAIIQSTNDEKGRNLREEQVDVLYSVFPYLRTSDTGILTRNHNMAYTWDCTYANLLPTLAEGFDVVTLRTCATRGGL